MHSTCRTHSRERLGTHLAGVDALASSRQRRLVLRLEHDVHYLEDSAIAGIVRHHLPVLRVALREQAWATGGDHGRRRRAKDSTPTRSGQARMRRRADRRQAAWGRGDRQERQAAAGERLRAAPALLLLLQNARLELLLGELAQFAVRPRSCGTWERSFARVSS